MSHKITTAIESSNPSLVVAQANLLETFGVTIDPVVLARVYGRRKIKLRFDSVAKVNLGIRAGEVKKGWPETSSAIIKFNDHYCLVIDPQAKTILDSVDGSIKSSAIYGDPTESCEYIALESLTEDLDNLLLEQDLIDRAIPSTGERLYTLKDNETVWTLAQKLKIDATDLIEHNDLEKPHDIGVGYTLHLPTKPDNTNVSNVRYEILDTPRTLYINKDTRKWSFGNASKLSNISNSGPLFKVNKQVEIVAIAYVTIDGTEYGYYMDAHAFGKFSSTGKVNYNIGLNWQDLSEEPITETVPTLTHEPAQIAEPEVIDIQEQPIPDPDLFDKIQEDLYPNHFKSTYKAFRDANGDIEARTYQLTLPEETDTSMMVIDYGGNKPSKQIYNGDLVECVGSFFFKGIEMHRPKSAFYFGIPSALLTLEDDMYTYESETEETKRKLGKPELAYAYLSRSVAKAVTMNSLLNKRIKINKD